MTSYVLGEEEVVLGFRLIGVAGYIPADRADALREFSALAAQQESVLLLVTETVAAWIGAEIRDAILAGTIVQVIPGVHSTGERTQYAEALVLSALGIKL